MKKTIMRLLNWAAERSDVLAKSRQDTLTMMKRGDKLQWQVDQLTSDVNDLMREVGKITQRMATVRVGMLPDYGTPRIRICIDIDKRETDMLLEHGNDKAFITYMGDWIGHQAADEISKCNFVRF